MSYTDLFTISYNDKCGKNIANILKEYGVVIVTNVFSNDECDQYMTNIVDGIKTISPELSIDSFDSIESTWNDSVIMPQVRKGLHQIGYSFLGWPVRGSSIIKDLNYDIYSELRGYPVTKTVTSIDGINIKPPIAPFHEDTEDWAHVDQTESDFLYKCVQSQVVLTTTTAGFRCSPKSHLIHNNLLKKYNKLGNTSNFFKFAPNMYSDIQQMVDNVGGKWQIPIIAPKGSMIFWLPCTIHSAKLADKDSCTRDIDKNDIWKNWRGVIYVCHRPKDEIDNEHIKTLQYAVKNNLATNHWGDRLFKPTRFKYSLKKGQCNERIIKYTNNPKLIYRLPNLKLNLTNEQKELIGIIN